MAPGSQAVGAGQATTVAISGTLAYLGVDNFFTIVDISNPSNPSQIACEPLPWGITVVTDIDVVGSYAYLAVGLDGLLIFDVNDPTHPTLRGSFPIPIAPDPDLGVAKHIQVVDKLAYLAAGINSLQIIDVTDPTSPTLRGYVNATASSVQVIGNLAYVTNNYKGMGQLRIVDVSDPAHPVNRGFIELYAPEDVWVADNLAYVAMGDGELAIVDVTDPTSLSLRSHLAVFGSARTLQVVGAFAYITALNGGLNIVEVSDPAQPILRGSYATYANDAQVIDSRAYIAAGSNGLQSVDVSDAANPTLVNSFTPQECPNSIHAVFLPIVRT